ncbi:hypothetical protein M407DRAFT_28394 [Tulasnella calospora MUT 4182]|uniref:Uncharacterized protein n=1 Tax=Tulasnella calospora MUT 4182 TaxID=1051891 RepID=A0A0C3LL00_9AGAM|nr:hypothetical protein M407DRAFT_28394 [Tulasnella calospora MUT 4182]
MDTFATDISSGLVEDITASNIAESAVDAVIGVVRSDLNSTRPTAGLLTLVDVDREMDSLAVTQGIFSDILARRMAILRRQHNAMLPINKLPAELLAHIISMIVHSQTWSVGALASLAGICSRWWRIVITTPSLWTTARMFKRPELIIKKSKELPITVRVQDWTHSDGEMKQFMDVVGPHSHRWEYVFIQTPFTDHVFPHLTRPLPCLEGLSLGFRGSGEQPKHLTLATTPKLRHLRLLRITLNWKALAHISLKTFSIKGLREAHVPKLQEMYNILASSPELTSLALSELSESADAEGFLAEPLSLPRLRTVEICEIGEHTTIVLAKLLQAENLHGLTVVVRSRSSSNISDFEALLHPPNSKGLLPSIIRNQGWNAIYAKVWPASLEVSDKVDTRVEAPVPLSLRIRGAVGFQLALLLGSRDRGYNIDLDITESRLKGEEVDQVLCLLDPSVLRLGPDRIASTMMALSATPPPSQEWFCPNLGEVHLMSASLDLIKTAKTLRARNGSAVLKGASRLTAYNAAGEVFSAKTVSFNPKSSPGQATPAQQSVE